MPKHREAGEQAGGRGEGLRLGVERRPHRPDQQDGEDRPRRPGPRTRSVRAGPARMQAGSYGNAGSGSRPTSPKQVGQDQRLRVGSASAPPAQNRVRRVRQSLRCSRSPRVAGGQQRGDQQGEGQQRQRPPGNEVVADPDVLVGPALGGFVSGRGSAPARAACRRRRPGSATRSRRRPSSAAGTWRSPWALIAIASVPAPAQRHLLAEADRGRRGGRARPTGPEPDRAASKSVAAMRGRSGRAAAEGLSGLDAGADHERRLRVGDAGLGDHERLVDLLGLAVRASTNSGGAAGAVAAAVGRGEDQRLELRRERPRSSARPSSVAVADALVVGARARRPSRARRQKDRAVRGSRAGSGSRSQLDVVALEARIEGLDSRPRRPRSPRSAPRRGPRRRVAGRSRRAVGGECDDRPGRARCLGTVEGGVAKPAASSGFGIGANENMSSDERGDGGQQGGAIDPRVEHGCGGETNLLAWPKPRLASCSSTTRSRSRRFWRIRSARRGTRWWSPRDGREGLDQFAAGRFDLVVLDVMMPRIDGIEVCRRLRPAARCRSSCSTARDDEVDKVLGLEIGADDYITKPFSVREFRSRVKAALRRTRMSGDDPDEGPITRGRARRSTRPAAR